MNVKLLSLHGIQINILAHIKKLLIKLQGTPELARITCGQGEGSWKFLIQFVFRGSRTGRHQQPDIFPQNELHTK